MPESYVRHNSGNGTPNAPRSTGNATSRKLPRQWNEKGFLPFRLEILTPVHIGSGETLSPLEYVVRQKGEEWRLYRLDMRAWFEEFGQDKAVLEAIESGNLKSIQKVVNEKTGETAEDAERLALFSCRIPDKPLVQALQQVLDRQSDKKGEVDAIMRNPADGSVCLPGSSLKGALSTPLINWQDQQKSDGRDGFLKNELEKARKKAFNPNLDEKAQQRAYRKAYQEAYRKCMSQMFDDIRAHAMQALKVSDVPIAPDICHIVPAEEKARKAEKTPTPKNACEVIPADAALYGRLLFDSASGKPQILGPGWTADFDTLRMLCNAFYLSRLAIEYGKFYTLPHLSKARDEMDKVLQKIAAGFGPAEQSILAMVKETIQRLSPNADPHETAALFQDKMQKLGCKNPPLLLRVGHYSHVECVTVDANAPKGKKISGAKGPVFGTTRTLASGKQPFGWVLLHFCSPEEYTNGILQTETDIGNAISKHQALAQEATERKEAKALEAERAQREAEKRQAEKEQKRQAEEARLAAMSPEEREIKAVASLQAKEDNAVALYNKLDALDEALRNRAAQVLQAFWQNTGKWEGKSLSKKQAEKVKKVKSLLAKEA